MKTQRHAEKKMVKTNSAEICEKLSENLREKTKIFGKT